MGGDEKWRKVSTVEFGMPNWGAFEFKKFSLMKHFSTGSCGYQITVKSIVVISFHYPLVPTNVQTHGRGGDETDRRRLDDSKIEPTVEEEHDEILIGGDSFSFFLNSVQ